MAKTSKRVKDQQRRETVRRYAARRAELKRIIKAPVSTAQERAYAQAELQAQPRDASATRVRNRDATDGRPRGYVGLAGVSRIRFRELAHAGQLPGITKSSW